MTRTAKESWSTEVVVQDYCIHRIVAFCIISSMDIELKLERYDMIRNEY